MERNGLAKTVEWVTSLAVIVSLVVLVVEVRANTRAIERQILLDRYARIASPFIQGPELIEAVQRVKAVDGWPEVNQRLMERYGLTEAQAVAWSRHLMMIWLGLEADFASTGPSPSMAAVIQDLLQYPDNQVFRESWHFSPEFSEYMQALVPSQAASANE